MDCLRARRPVPKLFQHGRKGRKVFFHNSQLFFCVSLQFFHPIQLPDLFPILSLVLPLSAYILRLFLLFFRKQVGNPLPHKLWHFFQPVEIEADDLVVSPVSRFRPSGADCDMIVPVRQRQYLVLWKIRIPVTQPEQVSKLQGTSPYLHRQPDHHRKLFLPVGIRIAWPEPENKIASRTCTERCDIPFSDMLPHLFRIREFCCQKVAPRNNISHNLRGKQDNPHAVNTQMRRISQMQRFL